MYILNIVKKNSGYIIQYTLWESFGCALLEKLCYTLLEAMLYKLNIVVHAAQ